MASPAFANCPDPTLDGANFAATGAQLLAPQVWDISAGGNVAAPCADWAASGVNDGQISGYLSVPPTGVFDLTGMGPHILIVRARSQCGAVLAVRSGDGVWYFGDEDGDTTQATLWGVPDGPLKVWVGSKTPDICAGVVELETYDR